MAPESERAKDDFDAKWGLYRSPEKSEADKYADESEAIATELLGMNASGFTVREICWLLHFIQKLRWGTTAEQELETLEYIRGLRQRINGDAHGE